MLQDMILFILFLTVLLILAWPLGKYMYSLFFLKTGYIESIFTRIETIFNKLCGFNTTQEMNWKQYAGCLLLFNLCGLLAVFFLQLFQDNLPFNPEHMKSVKPDLAFNTAVSFVTNTNWQAYGGETTMSYFTQMTGLTVQNFLSAATGICVSLVLIRGLTKKSSTTIGNFWQDMLRSTVGLLIPLSLAISIILMQQGVIQNLSSYLEITTLEGLKQIIPMGPVASQEAIKLLGTNGGGFFNTNSAHPFENPTGLTNLIEMLSILIIPTALLFTFGLTAKNSKQGYTILTAMLLLFIVNLGITYTAETFGNPLLADLGVESPTAMEGKEVRFGIANTALFTTVTTAASCGAVNSMHDSLTPLGGLIPLLQMMLGEVVIGGVGAGFYGMMLFVLLTVFIVGLMVGRTPEYLGKKIEVKEIKMAVLAIIAPSSSILLGTALSCILPEGTQGPLNAGPHGFSEILYAFASGAGNNGSAFAGLTADTPYYNLMVAAAMLIGRFGVILPILVIANSLAAKKITPASAGTFSTSSGLFTLLLTCIVFIVGALTFLPALTLGPILEHLLMLNYTTF